MLTRLDRYLLREATVTFTAVTGVLLVILLSNQFARILGQAAQAGLSGRIVLALVGLTTLQQLTILLPVGLFLGIVLALGRLYHESEMTAVGACGIGPLSIYRPVVLLAVVVAAVLAPAVLPRRTRRRRRARSRSAIEALRVAQFGALEPGRFRSFAGGDAVFYAERVDRAGQLYGVFVQRRVEDRIELAVAERAEQRGAGQMEQEFVLYDGRRYEGVPGSPEWRVVEFREHGIPVRLPEYKAQKERYELKPTAALLDSDEGPARAELAWRARGAGDGAGADGACGSARKAATTAGTLRAHRVRDSRVLSLFEPARGSTRLDGEGFSGRPARLVVGAPAAARPRGRHALGRGASRLVAPARAAGGRLRV